MNKNINNNNNYYYNTMINMLAGIIVLNIYISSGFLIMDIFFIFM